MTAPQIGFISLGCPKALVDSERILTKLRPEGYTISASYQEADLGSFDQKHGLSQPPL